MFQQRARWAVVVGISAAALDTTTSVRSLGDSFAVDIKSNDPAVAQESIRRAETLARR